MTTERFMPRRSTLALALALTLAGPALAQPSPETLCQRSVQGRIAWDYSGSTRWGEENLERLCRGAASPYAPGVCFNRVMHSGIDWGGGSRWQWRNALDLCAGATDAAHRIECFQRQLEGGRDWRAAIEACTRRPKPVEFTSQPGLQEITGFATLDPTPGGSATGGDTTRTILPDGTVEIRHPDGRRVQLHAGGQTIIYPDGREEVLLYSTGARPPIPPSLPSSAETAWLEAHSAALLELLRRLVGDDDAAIGNYLEFEGSQASVYDQIVKREQTIGYLVSGG